MIGQRIGQYEIVEEVGKGGMATVYRAFQPMMERFVAVKVIHRFVAEDTQNMQRFRQEARLISKLEHPHLLPIYEYNADYDPPYIVMRFLEGGSLKEALQDRGYLPLGEIAHLMRQVCSVLDYAHRQNVVHRDIKPANIMIDKEGNAFLTDFGIARSGDVGAMTQTGFTMGTPGYMSPEQSMGEALDLRTDIYALGVVLFEMATGFPPFFGETPMKLIMNHINQPVPNATDVQGSLPLTFDMVIHKALAKTPQERYDNAMQLYQDLERVVGSTAANAKPVELSDVADKLVKRQEGRRDEAQIQTLLNQFAINRGMVTNMPDIKTVNTPTPMRVPDSQYKTPPSIVTPPAPTSQRLPWLLSGVLAILLFIGGGFAVLSSNPAFRAVVFGATETPTLTSTPTLRPSDTPTQTPQPSDTSTPRPSDTPTLTPTPRPSDTPLPTNTPLPTHTPTPSTPIFMPRRDLPVLAGASAQYAQIATISANEEFEIVGRSADGRYYNILLPNGSTGWVIASAVNGILQGNAVALKEVIAPTITPSATPTFTTTPSHTPTFTLTPSHTPTFTLTPSHTPTFTLTPSHTPTFTLTPSLTPSVTPTNTLTPSLTPSVTPTNTITPIPLPTAIVCAGALPSRLRVGEKGAVTVDQARRNNRVREFPGAGFELMGLIPPGGVFEVWGEAECADGFTWWYVNYNGLVGWTPEGNNVDYWLYPVPLAPNEQPFVIPTLEIGGQALVFTQDEGLNFRPISDLNGVILGFVPVGGVVDIIDGPREIAGYTWWKIRDFTFREGWAVGAADGVITLIPLRERARVIPQTACKVTTIGDTFLYTSPSLSANGDNSERVGSNNEFMAIAESLAEPGSKWYWLTNEKWVLENLVTKNGDCDALARIR
jgi:serine/threonine-protein kinase